MKADHYSIGELSRLTGVSVRALRHYEQIGVLPAQRTASGYRVFMPAAVEHVKRIQVLLKNGFTLAQIQPVVSVFGLELETRRSVCGDVIRLYHAKLEELDERIASLVALREQAAARLAFIEQQRRAGGPA
ncbi:MerR family transcriptional regulator [Massilia sp. IC2-477]|uniref:MerR family transcriptional regulator n=1 Tax=unclassified Massilia TaxID=2609279 RepID=UPI001D111F66|nr:MULTISPECIES: MerR family transcriptional regulator [unclassified Massilia]MCC2958204.1 MerR family transcriptional regulator [Massilia sp. IC2-477]MCC2971248.1 MerR family transcriptional regulator [Massilia sp. IC2-476]